MTCKHCGRYAPPCPETGYDADDVCNDCANAEAREDRDVRIATGRIQPGAEIRITAWGRFTTARQGGDEL